MSNKRTKDFSLFLSLSALGFAFLVVLWYLEFFRYGGGGIYFASKWVFIYYIVLPIILLVQSVLLYKKFYKIFSFISVFVFLLFFGSLIIKVGDGWHIYRTLFFSTIYLGMSAGGLYGGSILIPMFLVAIVSSFVQGVSFLARKISYESLTNPILKDKRFYFFKKGIFYKVLPLLAVLANYFNFKKSFQLLGILFEEPEFSLDFFKNILIGGLPLIVGILALFSFFARKKKTYFILNIILFLLLIFPYLVIWFL